MEWTKGLLPAAACFMMAGMLRLVPLQTALDLARGLVYVFSLSWFLFLTWKWFLKPPRKRKRKRRRNT